MYYVYVLSDHEGKLYKGMTGDLSRRIKEHKRGKTKTTRSMLNIRVVYLENIDTLVAARIREKYLKSAAGRRFLKDRLG